MKNETKFIDASITSSTGTARTFEAIATTDAMDRDGEVVLPEGMDQKDYMANPILLWMHDADHPVGKVVGLTRQSNGWSIKGEIASRPADFVGEWKPDAVWGLLKAGVLRGISIGFLPVATRAPSAKDLSTWGDSLRRVITRYKLCEISLVSVPCNQESLVTAVSKGLLSKEIVKKVFDVEVEDPVTIELITVQPIATIVEPVVKTSTLKRVIYYEETITIDKSSTAGDIVARAVAMQHGKLYY